MFWKKLLPLFLFDFLPLPLIYTLLVASTSDSLTTVMKISYFSSNEIRIYFVSIRFQFYGNRVSVVALTTDLLALCR